MNGQTFLSNYEQSERDMIDLALKMSLERKIERAKMLLRTYERSALEMSQDGYYLAFSGGKDSCVIKQLAIESGVKFKAFYDNTTIDPPEAIYFMRRHHADVLWNNPRANFFERVRHKGLPTRTQRWCCKEFKEQNGLDRFKVIGVRVSESQGRMKAWREFVPNRDRRSFFLAPIVYWTDNDVWKFIKDKAIPYCELYDQGFKRIGCIGCPKARNHAKVFKRYPRHKALWRKAAFDFFNLHKGVPRKDGKPRHIEGFATANDYWDWWISGKRKIEPDAAQCVFEEMMSNA